MSRVVDGKLVTAFKDPPRKVDKKATARSVAGGQPCGICGERGETGHHVIPKGAPHFGDDVPDNIVNLCGHGTKGCHGDVEARRGQARKLLGQHIKANRPDVVAYVKQKLGDVAGIEYLRRHYGMRGVR